MAEAYAEFLSFDWGDERWRAYLNGLYPPPNQEQIAKFKKKWYKKNIDVSFDESYEPAQSWESCTAQPPQEYGPLPKGIYHDGSRWSAIGQKATICFAAYCVALVMAVGSWAGVFPPYQVTVIMVVAFILEIVAKFGVKFSKKYMHNVLVDDVGTMPIMAATLMMPGLHTKVRLLAVLPMFLTALLSFGQICKFHKQLPDFVRDFWSPLATAKARKQVMRARADVEVALGLIMVVGALFMLCAPITVILFWNFMMMRYMMSSWTQDSFQRIDHCLSPVLMRVPGVKQGYQAVKAWLYSYVDPESKSAGKLCSIL
ncbi:unnamed protein product [Durusdinium trenchii]|uniref:Uncharacterized protein n=2 Tax=Durusdinium trenchii TaxID=1381693 RepID=A0ABP0M919_9DINO